MFIFLCLHDEARMTVIQPTIKHILHAVIPEKTVAGYEAPWQ